MKVFLLKKMVVISFLLAISFIIEFIFNRFVLNIDCCQSFIKLELLPIILIGFLFGFKLSFFSNLLYVLIHIVIEFAISYQKHSLLTDARNNYKLLFIVLLFIFIIPYLVCSISGFCSFSEKKNFFRKKTFFLIFFSISILQIISYLIFITILYNNFSDLIFHLIKNFSDFLNINNYYFNYLIYIFLIYNLLSIILNNVIIGFLLFYFLNYFFKQNEYIEYFLD